MNKALFSLAALAFAAPSFAVNFDNGVDVSAMLGEARAAAATAQTPAAQASGYRVEGRAYAFDCREIRFSATEKATTLSASLESRELDCQYGDNGNGKLSDCRNRTGASRQGSAAITVRNRKALLPWESDTFRVCMEGSRVDMTPLETAYEYTVVQEGSEANGWEFVVEPGAKRAGKTDPDGITARFASGEKIEFTDKWAALYPGQTVVIKYALKTEKSGWFDGTTISGEMQRATASTYSLRTPMYRLKAGVTYYVEYSFQRVGPTSKSGFTDSRKSETLVYTEASLPR